MVMHSQTKQRDAVFAVLADPTRRAIVSRRFGDSRARPPAPSAPASGKPLEGATEWLEQYRQLWERRFNELDGALESLKSRRRNSEHPNLGENTHEQPWRSKSPSRGDREIGITRRFNAPRRLAWEAYHDPELLKKWLLGPPGWSMVCKVARKAGELYHYVWAMRMAASLACMAW